MSTEKKMYKSGADATTSSSIILGVTVCCARKVREMVKLVVLIAAFAVISNVSAWRLFPDASNAETVAYSNKIASGGAPAKGFGADYVLLSVVFVQQAQICGGVLVTDSYVLTSASCLVE